MKAFILVGGKGNRLAEETHLIPKPMVEIAGKPLIWHIMKIFSKFGITDFIICAGYKGHVIKRYFADFAFLSSDVTFNISENTIEIHQHKGLWQAMDTLRDKENLEKICTRSNKVPWF